MPSASGTPNLGLRQWTLDDPFLMEEMNENNRRIDAALAENPWVGLMEVTSNQAAGSIEIELSQIDLSPYSMLELDFLTPEPQEYMYLSLNNITDVTKYEYYSGGTWAINPALYLFSSNFQIDLSAYRLLLNTPQRAYRTADYGVTSKTLKSVQIYCSGSQPKLLAGTKIILRGRKK